MDRICAIQARTGDGVRVSILPSTFDDAIFLPAPDFGNGPKIGAASWQFGVSAKSAHPDGAAKFIEPDKTTAGDAMGEQGPTGVDRVAERGEIALGQLP